MKKLLKRHLKAKASLFLRLYFRIRSAVYERRKSLLLPCTVCDARSKTPFKVFINVLQVRKPAKIFKWMRFPRRHFCILLLLKTKVWRSVRRSAHFFWILKILGFCNPKPARGFAPTFIKHDKSNESISAKATQTAKSQRLLGLLPKPALLLKSKQIAAKSIFFCIVRQFRNSKNIIKTFKVFFSDIRKGQSPYFYKAW